MYSEEIQVPLQPLLSSFAASLPLLSLTLSFFSSPFHLFISVASPTLSLQPILPLFSLPPQLSFRLLPPLLFLTGYLSSLPLFVCLSSFSSTSLICQLIYFVFSLPSQLSFSFSASFFFLSLYPSSHPLPILFFLFNSLFFLAFSSSSILLSVCCLPSI